MRVGIWLCVILSKILDFSESVFFNYRVGTMQFSIAEMLQRFSGLECHVHLQGQGLINDLILNCSHHLGTAKDHMYP